MSSREFVEPVDYLAVGHITIDQTPDGPRLGGSVAYAALTAQALGLRSAMGWTTPSTAPSRRTLTMAAVNVSAPTLWDRPRASIAAP